jgi:hypothetical protein
MHAPADEPQATDFLLTSYGMRTESVEQRTLTPLVTIRIQVPQPGNRPQIAAYLSQRMPVALAPAAGDDRPHGQMVNCPELIFPTAGASNIRLFPQTKNSAPGKELWISVRRCPEATE